MAAPDYAALAKEFGGTVAAPAGGSSAPDFAALAAEFGGTVAQPDEPRRGTTAAGVSGAVVRGLALPAATTAAGAALGAPFAGVGAVPGAAAGLAAGVLTQAVGDPIVSGINRLFGTSYTMPTDAMADFLTRVGVPQARTEAEKIVQAASSGAAGGGGSVALGRTLQSMAPGRVAGEVGRVLAAQPAAQISGGVGAAAAGELAKQEGVGVPGQIVASLVGGVAGTGAALPGTVQAAQSAARTVAERTRAALPGAAPAAPAARPQPVGALARGPVGSAGTSMEAERVAVAESMPVPFTGPTALTAGQRSRDFAQLQFEKETAKLAELGEPLRERVQAQSANFIRNFDALIDLPQPIAREGREIGRVVTDAIVNRAEVKRREISRAYQAAREAGQMTAPVPMTPLATGLGEMASMEGVVPMIGAVRREATRLGAITTDDAGNIIARELPVNDAETLRQFVNQATDWTNPREAVFGRRINSLIDQATENAGGDLYRRARRMRVQFADEFENVGLTARLIGTKAGTSERQIALEDVFDKVILVSPVEEMNKVRGTLLRSGDPGKQAWGDLKAAGVDYIKRKSLSASERDAAGNPLLSPAQLQRTVQALDLDGKLEALYGKKQAQTIRDLAELSSTIYTAPPGAINTSNTASALQVAMDSLITFGATGVPAPVLTMLREANKYVKNRETRKRIAEALAEPNQ